MCWVDDLQEWCAGTNRTFPVEGSEEQVVRVIQKFMNAVTTNEWHHEVTYGQKWDEGEAGEAPSVAVDPASIRLLTQCLPLSTLEPNHKVQRLG
jgi:hypothetical protein